MLTLAQCKTRMRTWRLHTGSFALGLVVAMALGRTGGQAAAFDLNDLEKAGGHIAKSFQSLTGIKGNLDTDVKMLRADATRLIGDKDKVLTIKNQLTALATQTKAQIESISAAVAEVEAHLNDTKSHVTSTGQHVDQIDGVRSMLK